MPSIVEAYNYGKEIRKVNDYLTCDYSRDSEGAASFTADVLGGSQDYHVAIRQEGGEWFYHCDCPDFRFTFYPYLEERHENIASFETVESTGKGMPRHVSRYGMCKHLLCTVETLVEKKEIII